MKAVKSTQNTIKGIHAVNKMEQIRDRRNGEQYQAMIINGKILLVMTN